MTTLSAANLTVAVDGKTLIDGVDLIVRPGEMIAVLGPNGAGKSTLLRAMSGLITPASGSVTLDDRALSAWPARDLAAARAFLPQNAALEWPLTVERVVALGRMPLAGLWGEARGETGRAVDAALAEMDALDLKGRIATTLSGGELARVLLARAIVGDPRILIADEPLAGLDPRHQLDALKRLRTLSENGRAIVIAMHDLDLAARFATRVVLLSFGKVIANGPPRETLTAERIAEAFHVQARVGADESGAWVRLLR
ncbi:MAG: ATP-binding cassette domain-containing protein [Hyphomonadaceae bacterium]|nr:MAG: iron complex transport system ATP-binding protein [Caulobacteraceae bacterium]MBT9446109.1 ATP-binding cassette domain-containing protein [Hyphomonadaceae bacterium]TPW03622.1 MAG: iron complex transport system ATP-binding protein [Alphaproteobacteria bacterium]